MLLLSAMFATVTLLSANDARRLAATHVQVTATVLDNRIVTSNAADDGAETHYVTYTFTRGDVVIKNERGMPEDPPPRRNRMEYQGAPRPPAHP